MYSFFNNSSKNSLISLPLFLLFSTMPFCLAFDGLVPPQLLTSFQEPSQDTYSKQWRSIFNLFSMETVSCWWWLPLARKAQLIPQSNLQVLSKNGNQIHWPHFTLLYNGLLFHLHMRKTEDLILSSLYGDRMNFNLPDYRHPEDGCLILPSHSGLLDSKKLFGRRNPLNRW